MPFCSFFLESSFVERWLLLLIDSVVSVISESSYPHLGFSLERYWSALPTPSPDDFINDETEAHIVKCPTQVLKERRNTRLTLVSYLPMSRLGLA